MTPAQIRTAVNLYEDLIRKWVRDYGENFPLALTQPIGEISGRWRYPEDLKTPDSYDTALHILWMLGEMREQLSDPSKIEKTMRWLGFVQGVLWASGLTSIKEMKEHNT